MSLIHSPEDKISTEILIAVSNALLALETILGEEQFEIGREDCEDLNIAIRKLSCIKDSHPQ